MSHDSPLIVIKVYEKDNLWTKKDISDFDDSWNLTALKTI